MSALPAQAPSPQASPRPRALTPRSLLVGAGLSFFLAVAEPYSALVNFSTGWCADFITAGALVLFFVFVGVGNSVLGLIRRDWALAIPELVVVYAMLLVTSAIPTWGLVANLLPIMAGLKYYATPSNEWEELLFPHVPEWVAPRDPWVCQKFFEGGLKPGEAIPWGAWAMPLTAWFLLIAAVYLTMVCMMVILRKQWVENERLLFPLNSVPLEIVREESAGEILKPFFRHKLLWLGFAAAFLLNSWNGFAYYFPFFSQIFLNRGYRIFRGTTWIALTLSFPVIGFCYFINLDVALSLWLFALLSLCQTGLFNLLGLGIKGHNEVFCGTSPTNTHMGMGAMIVLVLFTLWVGRSHLKDVFRKAFRGDPDVDDSQEMMSYRTAVFGTLVGLLIIGAWMKLAYAAPSLGSLPPEWSDAPGLSHGISVLVILIYLFGAFVTFLGLTRIISEGGFGFARAQCTASVFTAYSLPSKLIGPGGLCALAETWTYAADVRTIVMTSALQSFHIADNTGTSRRQLLLPIGLALGIALFASVWQSLRLAYGVGGTTFQNHGWFYNGMPNNTWKFALDKLLHPIEWSQIGPVMRWTAVGAAIMFFLMFMRHRFLWWPLHYLGYPIGDCMVLRQVWLSVMIAWLVKSLILKYGGIRLFRQLKPLFLGFIMGQLMAAAVFAVSAFVTGERMRMGIWIGVP